MPYLSTGTPSLCHSHKRDLHVLMVYNSASDYSNAFYKMIHKIIIFAYFLHCWQQKLPRAINPRAAATTGEHEQQNKKVPVPADVIPNWMWSTTGAARIPALALMGCFNFLMGKTRFLLRRTQFQISTEDNVILKFQNKGGRWRRFLTVNSLTEEDEGAKQQMPEEKNVLAYQARLIPPRYLLTRKKPCFTLCHFVHIIYHIANHQVYNFIRSP